MIKIAYNKRIDEIVVRDLEQYFQSLGAQTESREQEEGASNAIWWALPPLMAIWIGKAFLDGFLKELGKDSAGQFKKVLHAAYTRLRNTPVRCYTRNDLEKIDKGAVPASVGQALPVLCISLQIEDTIKRRWGIRCILPAELSEDRLRKAIEEIQSVLPRMIEFERENLRQLTENQILLGSSTYIYDMQEGWVSQEQMLLKKRKTLVTSTPSKRRSRKRGST